MTELQLLTRQQVEKTVGIRRSTIYKLMREGKFPEPLKISNGCVRWQRTELEAWINSRPKARGEHAGDTLPE